MKAQFAIDGARIRLDRDRPRDRRREDRGARRGRHRALARTDLPGAVARALSAHARAVLQERDRGISPATATSTGVFHLFKGGRDLTGTFTSAARRRERLPLPVAVRVAALDADVFEVWDAGVEVLRRRRAVRLLDQAARPEDAADSQRFDATVTGVDLAQLHRLRAAARPAVRRRGRRCTTCSSGRSGKFSEHRGEGHLVVAPPPGRDADDGVARRRARGRRQPRRHEWGPFAPLPLPAPSADRGRADVSLRAGRGHARVGALRDRAHARHASADDRVGRAIAAAVPRHEQRLAGKRSGARRHHDATSDRRPARSRSAAAASSTA